MENEKQNKKQENQQKPMSSVDGWYFYNIVTKLFQVAWEEEKEHNKIRRNAEIKEADKNGCYF